MPAVAFDVGGVGGVGTGTFHPKGEARKQEENHSRLLVPRAPFQPDQVWLQGLIAISDQLFRLPEAWAGCGGGGGACRDGDACQAGPASDEWWPGTGTMAGKGCASHVLGRLGFLGKQKSEGRWNVHC